MVLRAIAQGSSSDLSPYGAIADRDILLRGYWRIQRRLLSDPW